MLLRETSTRYIFGVLFVNCVKLQAFCYCVFVQEPVETAEVACQCDLKTYDSPASCFEESRVNSNGKKLLCVDKNKVK